METCEAMYMDIQPLIANEQHADAVSALKKLLEVYPDFAKGYHDLGVLSHALGYKKNALSHFRRAANIAQGDVVFIKTMADFCYSEMGEVEEALKYYQKVLDIKPDEIDALMISGHIFVAEHRFEEAKKIYEKVLDLEPWNDDAWTYLEKLETCIDSRTDEKEAEEKYKRCLELANSGDKESAIKELEKLLRVYPDFALAYNDLGVLYYDMGDKGKTLECYEKATRLDPEIITFQKNLADFYYVEMGRVENALEIYAKVLSEEPGDVDSLIAAGYICEDLEKKDDAKIFYERVLDIEPWNLEASEHINNLYESGNDSSGASF